MSSSTSTKDHYQTISSLSTRCRRSSTTLMERINHLSRLSLQASDRLDRLAKLKRSPSGLASYFLAGEAADKIDELEEALQHAEVVSKQAELQDGNVYLGMLDVLVDRLSRDREACSAMISKGGAKWTELLLGESDMVRLHSWLCAPKRSTKSRGSSADTSKNKSKDTDERQVRVRKATLKQLRRMMRGDSSMDAEQKSAVNTLMREWTHMQDMEARLQDLCNRLQSKTESARGAEPERNHPSATEPKATATATGSDELARSRTSRAEITKRAHLSDLVPIEDHKSSYQRLTGREATPSFSRWFFRTPELSKQQSDAIYHLRSEEVSRAQKEAYDRLAGLLGLARLDVLVEQDAEAS